MDGLAFVNLVESELKKRGISKAEFYKGSGISSATFSQWRKCIYSPSSVAIKKIEDFLSISFAIEQKENKPTHLGEPIHPITQSLFDDIPKLSLEDQQAILAMIQFKIKNKEEN